MTPLDIAYAHIIRRKLYKRSAQSKIHLLALFPTVEKGLKKVIRIKVVHLDSPSKIIFAHGWESIK